MKLKRSSELYSDTGDYEHASKADWTATFIVLIIVVIGFVLFTALTEEPENQAQEAMGGLIDQLKT